MDLIRTVTAALKH